MGIRVEDTLDRLADEKVDMVWCDYSNSYKPAVQALSILGMAEREVCGSAKIPPPKDVPVAIKFDQGKPPMSLLSTTALVEIAKVLEFGKNKYGKNNYKSGMLWSRVLDAPLRHIFAFIDKEDNDPESGISHIAHACCSLMFLLEFIKTHPELDDR